MLIFNANLIKKENNLPRKLLIIFLLTIEFLRFLEPKNILEPFFFKKKSFQILI